MPKRKSEHDLAKDMFAGGYGKVKKPKAESTPVKAAAAKAKKPAAAKKKSTVVKKDPSSRSQRKSKRDEEIAPEEDVMMEEEAPQEEEPQDEATEIAEEVSTTIQPVAASVPPPVQQQHQPPASMLSTPPRVKKSTRKMERPSVPSVPVVATPNPRDPGLAVVQESLLREEQPLLAPEVVVVPEDDEIVAIPKASKYEFYAMLASILVAFVSLGAAIYFSTLEYNGAPSETGACPPGGYCEDGVLTHCRPYFEMSVDGSSCVLEPQAAHTIQLIDRLLHRYSFEHIKQDNDDENPFFARVEQDRPLYYLASINKALATEANVELLYAVNLLKPLFLVTDGFLVGVHPDIPIQASWYAHLQVTVRAVISAVTFFVWSVAVSLFAIYSSYYRTNKIVTVSVTVIVVFGVLVGRQYYLRRQAQLRKEEQVLKYRNLVFRELYNTSCDVSAEVLFSRVAEHAFPSSRRKREALKADVWRHILRDAQGDARIKSTETKDGNVIWQWTDPEPPK